MIKLKAILITLGAIVGAVIIAIGVITLLNQLNINQAILILQLGLAIGGATGVYLMVKERLEEKEYKRKEEESKRIMGELSKEEMEAIIKDLKSL